MFELYAMKVARTVLGGGKIRENSTYLNRPYAALLQFDIESYIHTCRIQGSRDTKSEIP